MAQLVKVYRLGPGNLIKTFNNKGSMKCLPWALVLTLLIIMGPMAVEIVHAQGTQGQDGQALHIFIESRFRLWDPTEKMMDKDFTISVFYFNETMNNTARIKILINGAPEYEVTFSNYTSFNYSYRGDSISLTIQLNNETVFNEPNIQIIAGITGHGLRTWKPTFLEINPGDWKAYQWNEFYSIVFGVLISIYVGFRSIKTVRRKIGGRKIA